MTGSEQIVLRNGEMSVALLSRGATTQKWTLGDRDLILGYDTADQYESDQCFVGAMVGRVANRIAGPTVQINGATVTLDQNEGVNTLHGGSGGIWAKNWSVHERSDSHVSMSVTSPDGDCGFPGNVTFTVTVVLSETSLTYTLSATTDTPTPISLAQHNYYTLGTKGATDLHLQLNADKRLVQASDGCANGKIDEVAGTVRDFSSNGGRQFADGTIDDFMIFDKDRDPDEPVATLTAPDGLKLRFWSDQAGAQVYSGHGLASPFEPGAGVCFEPSGYPNALNHDHFPSIMITPETPYHQTLKIEVVK
jgi:aldose 1-epimerase